MNWTRLLYNFARLNNKDNWNYLEQFRSYLRKRNWLLSLILYKTQCCFRNDGNVPD